MMQSMFVVPQQQRRRNEGYCSDSDVKTSHRRCCWFSHQLRIQVVVVVLQLFFILSILSYASAFSSGAGSCASSSDGAPVGGRHLEETNADGSKRTVLTGALSDGMVSVLINDNTNNPLVENTPYTLQTQTFYTITVVTTQEPGYKGILLRFSNTDNTINVLNDVILAPTDTSILQAATTCMSETNTIGLTHVTNTAKLSVTADLIVFAPGTIILDISIVGVNDDIASLYGHTGYILQVEGEAVVVTETPTRAPTRTPVTFPPGITAIPTTSPTLNDFLIDTLSPTYKLLPPSSPSSISNSNVTSPESSSSGTTMLSFGGIAPSMISWTATTVFLWSITSQL